jgi:DedD protein
MDQNIKQRLVGIAVIFALAVIFLPMILDGSGVDKKTLVIEIPDQPVVADNPEFDQKIIELHASVETLPDLEPRFVDENSNDEQNVIKRESEKQAKKVESAPTPAPVTKKQSVAKVEKAPKPKVVVKPPVGGESWVLQIGSFKDKEKAISQRDRLRKSNVAAVFIEKFDNNNQVSYRVRLGPFLNRDQAGVAQNKIRAKHDIEGLIMKYER